MRNKILTSFTHKIILFSLTIISSFIPAGAVSPALKFDGVSLPIIELNPERSTGIDAVYIAYGLENVSLSFQSLSPGNVKWFSFDNRGAAFASPIENISVSDSYSSLKKITADTGYIIEDGDKKYYLWIIDYLPLELKISSVSPAIEQECEATVIDISGSGDPIYFYSINGRRENISRDIEIRYNTLAWDSENTDFIQQDCVYNLSAVSPRVLLRPTALCPTFFEIKGDRFLKEWNKEISITTESFFPHSVEVNTSVTQASSDDGNEVSNIIGSDNSDLGGSAPVSISFYSYVTDAVIHNEWQIARDADFENILYRFNDRDLDFTFTEEGTLYVRFVGSNSDGSCEAYSDTYTVSIGSSELKIPNAFSPDDDGINDMWKVSYRSIIDFECTIFDRHGHEIFRFSDPSAGWDGKKGGKIVKPGVYFYVIKAIGADGKKYNRSGDINIIRYKGKTNQNNYE